MTIYNVINRSDLVGGQAEDVGDVLTNFDAIASIINGQLDGNNLKALANILFSQLNGFPSNGTVVAVGDGNWGLPKNNVGTPDPTYYQAGDGTWRQLPAAPPGVLTPITDTGELAATAATIDLTSIPQTYRDLRLITFVRSAGGGAANLDLACNGDATAANYDYGGTAGGTAGATTGARIAGAVVPYSAAPANSFGVAAIDVFNYRRTGPKVMLSTFGVYRYDGTLVGSRGDYQRSALWNGGAAAINRITLTMTNSFAIGSRAILYGVN